MLISPPFFKERAGGGLSCKTPQSALGGQLLLKKRGAKQNPCNISL